MFFSFDAGNFDDCQNVPEKPLAKGPTSTSVIGAVPMTESRTSVVGVVPMTDSQSLLCEDQKRVVDLVLQGLNVFYTGSAGTGKSTVLEAFVKRLNADDKKVHIIAPTNLAAQMIHGQIIWSCA
jgi:predicted AAA+ superfamily ATPase